MKVPHSVLFFITACVLTLASDGDLFLSSSSLLVLASDGDLFFRFSGTGEDSRDLSERYAGREPPHPSATGRGPGTHRLQLLCC